MQGFSVVGILPINARLAGHLRSLFSSCYTSHVFSVIMSVLVSIFVFIHSRILAPTTYIFFASALPVIAFGEQLDRATGSF